MLAFQSRENNIIMSQHGCFLALLGLTSQQSKHVSRMHASALGGKRVLLEFTNGHN